jgi:cobalt-zinc-cadmium efflux system membrane fusion protein
MNKKQKVSILAIIVIAILLGMLIMAGDKPAAGGGEAAELHAEAEHGHGEAEGHDDKEHHGSQASDSHKHDEGHQDEEHHEAALTKGPNGGQLFTEDGFGVEVLLKEEGGEPRFRVYLSEDGKPLPPTAAKVSMTLSRPSGETQEIALAPEKDALTSTSTIAEPHVFDATIAAMRDNTPFLFTFAKEEGKIELTDAQIESSGITLQTAGAAVIKSGLQLPGEIHFNQDRTAHVVPRVAGIVESVPANLGQQVKKGQVLAVVSSTSVSQQRSELLTAKERLTLARTTYQREKILWEEKISAEQDYLQARQALREAEIAVRNAQQQLQALGATSASGPGLNRFEVRAPFDGMVVEKDVTLGESVKEDTNIFTLSDLSTVWAEIIVPAKDIDRVHVGAPVVVRSTASDTQAVGNVAYVGSLFGERTRTAKARVVVPNPNMAWRPGLYITAELTAEETKVPVAVPAEAVQTIDDKPTVFVRVPGGFIAQPVSTGRSDDKQTEIVRGLKAGTQIAAAGSFIIKAELGKGSAEHSH